MAPTESSPLNHGHLIAGAMKQLAAADTDAAMAIAAFWNEIDLVMSKTLALIQIYQKHYPGSTDGVIVLASLARSPFPPIVDATAMRISSLAGAFESIEAEKMLIRGSAPFAAPAVRAIYDENAEGRQAGDNLVKRWPGQGRAAFLKLVPEAEKLTREFLKGVAYPLEPWWRKATTRL